MFTLISLFISLHSNVSFAQIGEHLELDGTTPLLPVGIASSVTTIASSVYLLSERQTSSSAHNIGKVLVASGSLAANIVPWINRWTSEEGALKNEAKMTDDERSEYRLKQIHTSYWIVGIDMSLDISMHLLADNVSTHWVTGVAMLVPGLTALVFWHRFGRGPRRSDQSNAGFTIEPLIAIGSGISAPSGIQLSYSF